MVFFERYRTLAPNIVGLPLLVFWSHCLQVDWFIRPPAYKTFTSFPNIFFRARGFYKVNEQILTNHNQVFLNNKYA